MNTISIVTGANRGLGRNTALSIARLYMVKEFGSRGITANTIAPGASGE
ncbi:hypothetical protein [Luteibacter sp. SG786]|nr:hypothetical protein [Luteibacter sp. SG786]NII53895.1 NAD(P)-dependent dehydrogenase (short-subunit alcohol dehydrogenase family) [Luteibacter sp. SG786]